MDDQVMPTVESSPRSKKKIVWIVVGVIVLIVIAFVIWKLFFHHKKAPVLTPTQTLQQLESSSQPVTSTVAQRADALNKVQKNSAHYIVTPQQDINILNALKK